MKYATLIAILLAAASPVVAQTTPIDTESMSCLAPDEIPARSAGEKPTGSPEVMDISPKSVPEGKSVVKEKRNTVLLIGDSMCDGLGNRFADYAEKNGFSLHTVIWYGSKTKDWATTRDLEYHIERVHPTYIIISLGTNDLGFYDYDRREGWVKDILAKVGNIPYLWIGPLSWKKVRDRTMVDVIRRNTGEGHFYDSTNILCQRVDGIHPTFTAAAHWADAIAKRMGDPSAMTDPFALERPDHKAVFRPDEKHTPKYKGRKAY